MKETEQITNYELMKHVLAARALNFALWDWDVDIHTDDGKSEKEALLESNFRWSQEFRQMLGFTDENDFPNTLQSWANQVHPEDFDRVMDAISAHLNDKSGETPYDLEYRLKTKSGEYRYFHEVGMTQRDEFGNPLRFVGGFEDIHERKEMARMLERNRKNYITSLESILNSIDALIYVSIPETGELLFVNNCIKKSFGREHDDMIGEKCYKAFRGLSEPCEFCKCPQLNEDPRQIIVWEEYNTFLNRHFLYSDSYIDWPNGKKVHLHHAKDITELTERKVAEEKARATSEAKSIFLANMSHEIRTPMNSIIGFCELAAACEVPSETKTYLSKISESAEMLLSIINDILDISKIESGKIELERIPFELEDVFAYCHSAILPRAREKCLKLVCGIRPPLEKKILGDPVRLRQVFLNMLSNAVKFTNTGTIELSAAVEVTDGGAEILFEVTDTGIGINDAQIKRIFEPFSQGDSSVTRKYGGTGLGLSIARSLIRMMGGELAVESAPGTGSKFSFKLKFGFAQDAEDKNGQCEEKGLNKFEKPVFEGEILVCEDNEMNQQVICEHLQNIGLRSVVAQNGKEGVETVKRRMETGEKPFDLIFMDINMPVMDGMRAVSELAALGNAVPVVALTANVMSGDLDHYRDAGMTDFLSKPFKSHELWKLLMKYLPMKSVSGIGGADCSEIKREDVQKTDIAKKNSVLIVDDEATNIITLTHILTPEYAVLAAKNGNDAVEVAREHLPDVILLDILMPGMSGYDVFAQLKKDQRTKDIPVIFITGLSGSDNEERGLALGAADYISKPFSPPIVTLRVRNQIQMHNQLEMIKYLSLTDQLTGISNRRDFDYRLRLEWDRAKRDKTPLSIFLIDIDNFKLYNDTYGHLQGDFALQIVAKIIEENICRSIDFVARWGGEEFVALLPCTELSGALSVAEKTRISVESAQFTGPAGNGKYTNVTISIGVNTCIPTPEDTINDFVDNADKALYEAKRTGKNKVCKIKVT